MKSIIGITVAVVLLAGAAAARAGDGCCPKGAKAKSELKGKCGDSFSKLDLTEEQKTKVAALREECDKTGCTQNSHEKMTEGLKSILTAEQFSQWKASCEKAREGGSCPFMKSTGKDSGKS